MNFCKKGKAADISSVTGVCRQIHVIPRTNLRTGKKSTLIKDSWVGEKAVNWLDVFLSFLDYMLQSLEKQQGLPFENSNAKIAQILPTDSSFFLFILNCGNA